MNKNDANRNVEPSTKRPRMNVDLNDSFYDSEEDELVSEACGMATATQKQTAEQKQATPKLATPVSSRTPISSISRLPTSATTLKGKPLTPSTTSVLADDDISVIHTSKPFFRMAKEVKELNEERDTLKGQNMFLEQSLRAKEKDNQEQQQRIAELTQMYTATLEEVREIQRRSDEEIVLLRTQLQFQIEQKKAGTFTGGKNTKENSDSQVSAPVNEESRSALISVQNVQVPVIKPRMSTSSVNKSFATPLKPRLSRGVGHVQENSEELVETYSNLDVLKQTADKAIQTDAFRIADVITDPDILAKRNAYGSILDTMIGATFIIDESNGDDGKMAEKVSEAINEIAGVDESEQTLDEILEKNCI